MATVLIVDDEPKTLDELRELLSRRGYEVATCRNTESAWKNLLKKSPELMILDVYFPGGPKGIELLERMNQEDRMVPTIMISGAATVEFAVKAIHLGAFDFVEKPFSAEKLLVSIERAVEMSRLRRENLTLRESVSARHKLLGSSTAMRNLRAEIERIADSRARVLILGENGTGKELVARAIHDGSPRKDKPFVKVNCAAIPKELVESEVFGYEKGAFTGAATAKRGRFELADSGTLFLDEVGDMDLSTQAKLLRFLETGEIERIGASRTTTVDVRLLAATNKDLEAEIHKGNFREDLYFRLSVLRLQVPPLRDRLEDLPELLEHFLQIYCLENSKPPKSIDPEAIRLLQKHHWPGNVRELRNLVERLVIMVDDPVVKVEDLSRFFRPPTEQAAGGTGLKGKVTGAEREAILKELEASNWKISIAAARLGIDRTNLYRKMKKYRIAKPEP